LPNSSRAADVELDEDLRARVALHHLL